MKLTLLGFVIGLIGLWFLMQNSTSFHLIGIIILLIGAGVALKNRRKTP